MTITAKLSPDGACHVISSRSKLCGIHVRLWSELRESVNNANVLEDEAHAVFTCPLFDEVREQFQYLLSNNTNIQSILNPNTETMVDVSKMLYAIQDVIDD